MAIKKEKSYLWIGKDLIEIEKTVTNENNENPPERWAKNNCKHKVFWAKRFARFISRKIKKFRFALRKTYGNNRKANKSKR